MKKLIKRILREEIDKSDRHYRRLDIISDHVQLPYFKSMVGLTIYDKDDQLYIMKKIYGYNIKIKGRNIYDDMGIQIYWEDSDGDWKKWDYDDKGNLIYIEESNGDWEKWEYDNRGREIYYEDSDGYWLKNEYDDNGNLIYIEESNGDWEKTEWDDRGKQIYYEDSFGKIIDNR